MRASAKPGRAITGAFPCTLTDSRGKTLVFNAAPRHIVSLAPSNTEVLYALGVGDNIVAVSSADDYPPEVKQKPRVGSVMTPAIESILVHDPDLVVAIASLNQQPIQALALHSVPLLVVDPMDLQQAYGSIRLLGQAVGRQERAETLVRTMQAHIEAISAVVRNAPKPRVLILYQFDPIYTTGPDSFIDEVIRLAGGTNIVDRPLPTNIISPEQVLIKQPEVILCDVNSLSRVRRTPGWKSAVPAVRNDRLFVLRRDTPLVRPTPRLVGALEDLACYLHPDLAAQIRGAAERPVLSARR